MTGKEAWSLVAPLITPLLAVKYIDQNKIYDLYVTVFNALKLYDERKDNVK